MYVNKIVVLSNHSTKYSRQFDEFVLDDISAYLIELLDAPQCEF